MRRGGNLTVDDALKFLKDVEVRFQDRIHDYNLFLRLMTFARDTNGQDFDVIHMAVATLFKGHPDLLQGFEFFLPSSLTLPQDDLKLHARVFPLLLSLRLPRNEFFPVLSTICRCRARGFDMDTTKTEIEKYIGQIPYLMEEFEKFWNRFTPSYTSATDSIPSQSSKPDDQQSPKDESNGKQM